MLLRRIMSQHFRSISPLIRGTDSWVGPAAARLLRPKLSIACAVLRRVKFSLKFKRAGSSISFCHACYSTFRVALPSSVTPPAIPHPHRNVQVVCWEPPESTVGLFGDFSFKDSGFPGLEHRVVCHVLPRTAPSIPPPLPVVVPVAVALALAVPLPASQAAWALGAQSLLRLRSVSSCLTSPRLKSV
jgi:hypothetical protein